MAGGGHVEPGGCSGPVLEAAGVGAEAAASGEGGYRLVGVYFPDAVVVGVGYVDVVACIDGKFGWGVKPGAGAGGIDVAAYALYAHGGSAACPG